MQKIFDWCDRGWQKSKGLSGVFAFLLLVAFLVGAIVYITNSYGQQNATVVIQVLQIILSFPVLGTLGFLVFLNKFSDSISSFLANHNPKTPFTEQRQQEEGAANSNISSDLTRDSVAVTMPIVATSSNVVVSDDSDFRYLALFFVDTTKRVLKWFFDLRENNIITNDSFNTAWQPFIPDSGQRATIFNVLLEYGMIAGVPGGAYSLTNKGERFLRFINFVN